MVDFFPGKFTGIFAGKKRVHHHCVKLFHATCVCLADSVIVWNCFIQPLHLVDSLIKELWCCVWSRWMLEAKTSRRCGISYNRVRSWRSRWRQTVRSPVIHRVHISTVVYSVHLSRGCRNKTLAPVPRPRCRQKPDRHRMYRMRSCLGNQRRWDCGTVAEYRLWLFSYPAPSVWNNLTFSYS